MEFLKNKEKVLSERLGSVYESTVKIGDTYKVKSTIDIPKSLINQFISKAKKENGVDAIEQWSHTDLAEMFVSYLIQSYMNIDSLPVKTILGLEVEGEEGQLQTQVEEPLLQRREEPIQQPVQRPIDNTGVEAQIQFENKNNKNKK